MKITLMFMMTILMSFSMVGQVLSYGNGSTKTFSNEGWYLNDSLIVGNGQTVPGNTTGEGITLNNMTNPSNALEISYSGFISTQSYINITKDISNLVINGNMEVKISFNDNGNSTPLYLVEYIGGNVGDSISVTNDTQFSINPNTDSIKLVLHTNVSQTSKSFNLISFNIYDIITNIQENITNNFNVYAYNKNLVVKTIEFEAYTLTVYNLSGQEVFTKKSNGNQDITLNLATGMYIVNINNGKESFNQKVVVQ